MRETGFTSILARVVGVPFRLRQRPFTTPKKALILRPCCLSQVLMTTPLLAVLSEAFPQAQFDWAVSDWARPAIAGNSRVAQLIRAGSGDFSAMDWADIRTVIQLIRAENYDTCFIPSRSGLLSLIAWQAQIPQRIGLLENGRGFAHTLPVPTMPSPQHEAQTALLLAQACNINEEKIRSAQIEFTPPDRARTKITQELVKHDWLSDTPLVIVHAGGGVNPKQNDISKRWPLERFVRVINHLVQTYQATVVLVGDIDEQETAVTISGLLSNPIINLAGQLDLGEIGALCEIADLYIGNDTGPTHVATAVGCPTIAIFGPSDPTISAPYAPQAPLHILWHEEASRQEAFNWQESVQVEDVIGAIQLVFSK